MPNKDYITIFDALAVKHWADSTLAGFLKTDAMTATLQATGDRHPGAKERDIPILTREIDAPRQLQRSTSSLGQHHTEAQSPNTTSGEGEIHSPPKRYSMEPGRE